MKFENENVYTDDSILHIYDFESDQKDFNNFINPKDTAVNPIDIENILNFSWNGTALFDSFIEYDHENDSFYIANAYYEEVPNTGININITKFNSNHEKYWSISIGEINITNYLQGMYLTNNGSHLIISEYETKNFDLYEFKHSKIHIINTTNGEIYTSYNLTEQLSNNIAYITDGKITPDDKYLYLSGITYSEGNVQNPFDYSNALFLKLNLFTHEIEWEAIWGDVALDEEAITFDSSPDFEFFYIYGFQYNNINNPSNTLEILKNNTIDGSVFLLQINSKGEIYYSNIIEMENDERLMPYDVIYDPDEDKLLLLSTFTNFTESSSTRIALSWMDLNGNLINITKYAYDPLTREVARAFYKSPWNNSYYIIGRVETSDYMKGYISEVWNNGTVIWENATYITDATLIDGYYDLAISSENEILTLVGLKGYYQNQSLLHLFRYNLTRVPEAPFIVPPNQVTYNNTVNLYWENSSRALNYSVYRSPEPFNQKAEAELLDIITDNNYTDILLQNGTYYYRVIASGYFGNSSFSNQFEIFAATNHTSYLKELLLEREETYSNSGYTITLNWTQSKEGNNYYVYRHDTPIFNYEDITAIGETTNNYWIDIDIPQGEWTYSILCEFDYDGLKNSSLSNNRTIYIPKHLSEPILSSDVVPEVQINGNPTYTSTITLNWSYVFNANNYSIHRSTQPFDECNETNLIAEGITDISYIDTTLESGLNYFRVVAHKSQSNSTSNIFEVLNTESPTPYLHSLDQAITNDNSSIHLQWTLNNVTADIFPLKYFIFRNNTPNFNYSETNILATIEDPNITEFFDSNVSEGEWYYGVVCNYFKPGGGVNSSLSNTRTITVVHWDINLRVMPEFYTDFNLKENGVNITWNSIEYATEYLIYRTHHPIYNLNYHLPIAITSEISFYDTPPSNNFYYWTIIARNSTHNSLLGDSIGYYVYNALETIFLEGPDYNVTDYKIELNWNSIEGINNYFIFKSEAYIDDIFNMKPYNFTYIHETNFHDIAESVGNLYYIVVGWNEYGRISISNCINVSIHNIPGTVEYLNFQGKRLIEGYPNEFGGYITGDRHVNISWGQSEGALYFEFYRSFSPILNDLEGADLLYRGQNQNYRDFEIYDGDLLYYTVVGVNHTGHSLPIIQKNLTVTFASDPLNFTLTQGADRSVIIEWEPGTYLEDRDFHRYRIFRLNETINNTNWSEGYQVHSEYGHTGNNFKVDEQLNGSQTYYYVITVESTIGNLEFLMMSNLSVCKSITIINTPFQPYLHHLESPNFSRNVTLVWDSNNENANYTIYRHDQPFSEEDLNSIEPIITEFEETTYIDLFLPAGIFYYGIVARNQTGNSSLSRVVSVDVRIVPKSPIFETVNDTKFINWLNISWNDPNDYLNYTIYRGNTSNFHDENTIVVFQDISTKWFEDNPINEGKYYYWIFAQNASGFSFQVNPLKVIFNTISSPVIQYEINQVSTNYTIFFSWKHQVHANKYYIFRQTDSFSQIDWKNTQPYEIISNLDGIQYFKEIDLTLGNYYYSVVGVFDDGESLQFGNISSAIEFKIQDLPLTPTLTSVSVDQFGRITVNWTKPRNVDYYVVYLSRNPINESTSLSSLISSPLLSNDLNSFTFSNVISSSYYVCVVSVNSTGYSKISNVEFIDNTPSIPEDNMNLVIGLSIGLFSLFTGFALLKYFYEKRKAKPINLFDE